ncbi:uncharacterized protein ACHE_30714S [Aspergillus chevalieri]|uniref:Uncharacterized protein n=1 Tax=Aspergillus chevalieri TaxID=182096 RepID=A0A7R7VL63_ASPCH|nr:uncharacterized protein ACHE_30714S [Aspergillus chevalieri]BCR86727.1 hypothetical protein ACHE_30714S [Aspergillus chevalieri]
MCLEQAQRIQKVEYRPPPKCTGPKYPTIMGVTPNRLKPKPKVAEVKKRENRRTRALKTLRNPDRMFLKWKGTKSYARMRMFRRLNGCLKVLQLSGTNQTGTMLADIPEQKPLEIEYKPMYRLKEIRRASMLLARPKPKRPVSELSIASIDSVLSTNRKRYSNASIYSRPMSTAQPSPAFSTENSSGQSSENVSLRASLVPYREWWAFLQSTPNPFREEEPNDERTNCDAQATLIHRHAHNSRREYSLFSSTHRNSLHSSRVFKAPEDNYTTPPSPTGSDLTITPSRYTFAQNMTESKSSSQDLLSNSTRSKGLGVEKAESVSDSKNKDTYHGDKRDSRAQQGQILTMEASKVEKPQSQLSPKDTSTVNDEIAPDSAKIQITRKPTGGTGPRGPRTPAPKTYPGLTKGARATPSAIPISVRRLSTEAADIIQRTSNGGFAGGIRILDKPSGPRSHPAGEPTSPSVPESIPETRKVSDNSTSSSSVGDWDLEYGEEEMQKPPTVFTGEYRTRPTERMGQYRYGPTLKIAGSADNIIMGTADDGSKSSLATQRSSPARVKYIETSKSGSSQDNDDKPKGQADQVKDQHTPEQQSPTRNFCRPQISLENLPKRDISNRELSVARKPLNRPSLSNLLVPSADKLHAETTPPVPKVLVSGDSVHTSSPQSQSPKENEDATPTHTPHQRNASSHVSTPATTPEQMLKNMPLRSHPPPRTSSLQAVADFPMHSESDANPKTPGEESGKENDTPQLKRDASIVNIPEIKEQDQTRSVGTPRIPDSKGTRMLDSFRNIFKHKSGTEKGRTRKEESGHIPRLTKDQSIVSMKSVKNVDEKAESVKASPTTKPRLSDGVGWSKVTRNPKTSGEYSPALVPTPSSTISTSASIPSPLSRNAPDDRTPSFARPTQSTRTKASTPGSKPQLSVGQDGHTRRVIQGVSASTGSPQRLLRTGTKRPSIASTTNRTALNQPRSTIPVNNQENTSPGVAKQPELAPKSFKEIRSFIDELCTKARDESTPAERERHLRLALALQQQLSDYYSVEKEAEEALILMKAKKADKDTAQDTLFNFFVQVRAQIEEQ